VPRRICVRGLRGVDREDDPEGLNKAAFVLATETSRHPGSVNRELNDLMGVGWRAEASTEQLREALKYAGDRLRELRRRRGGQESRGTGFASGGDPPF
jgi:hypothetical protein